ncbi:uncharacterized protein [Haliotis cracherodii]|uniref:uncharacterized protein n=1 Tax=Haliotis cracherodii TaxID=6455 RepID=UPI0039E82605
MNLKMIVYLLSACVLISAVAGQCPAPDDNALNLEPNTTLAVIRSYASLRRRISASATDRQSQMFLSGLENSKCAEPRTVPEDNPDIISRSNSKPLFEVSLAASACEPCPPRVNFLGRFYGSCYVIKPSEQQVRYVSCGKTCKQPCMCSRSYCQRTHYTKVWFLSYCTRRIGGFQSGLNFRFLWLPQDCACRNY